MADIKVLKVLADGIYQEHSEADDSIKIASLKTANYELTDTDLGKLVDGEDADDIHHHDGRYFREDEHITVRDGMAPEIGVPVITNGTGYIDSSLVDISSLAGDISHGDLQDLDADDHTQYLLVDGTRAMDGDLDMDSNNIINLASPTNAGDATNKAYVDAVRNGLKPKGNVRLATTAPLPASTYDNGMDGAGATLTGNANGLLEIDGEEVVAGNRVLIKDQANPIQNGIYVVTETGDAMEPFVLTRSLDQDNTPLHEVINGVFIPRVLEGDVNANVPFFIYSTGSGTDGEHELGTDDVLWDVFTSPSQLQAGVANEIDGTIINVLYEASGGLDVNMSNELFVVPDDFAGEGLFEDMSGDLAIDWSTTFDDAKAVKAEDLSSNSNGLGASIIGVEDANSYFTAENVEGVLEELYALATAAGGVEYDAGTNIALGQPVFISGDGEVSLYSDLTSNVEVIGVALNSASISEKVKIARTNAAVAITHTFDAGDRIYWDGSAFVIAQPTATLENVWLLGIAESEDSGMNVGVKHIKKNA